jgi:DNA-binding NtrC family response regulator
LREERGIRILAIDDEINFVDMLRQYFEPRGYLIDVESDAEKGLSRFSPGRYDVILLDLKMTGMSGENIMDRIRIQSPDIRVIFITAFSDFGKTKENLLKKGAFGYLEKPLSGLKELEGLIQRAADNIKKGSGSLK